MKHKIVAEIAAQKEKANRLRANRDDAAATLREAGFTSSELAENVSVQASRIRHYVSAGSEVSGYTTVADFEEAFNAWETADYQLSRLRDERDRLIHEALEQGSSQTKAATEFGVSQFLVSHIIRNKGEVTLL